MPRTKGGPVTHYRHKKVLNLTKGHQATRHTLYRRAHESMLHALSYAYRHRRERKGDMRRLWITRINAAAKAGGLSYNQLMAGLKNLKIEINRKILSEMATRDLPTFSKLLALVSGKSEK